MTLSREEIPSARPTCSNLLVLFLWLAACSLFAYWETLRLPYALDDLDHLHRIAEVRWGKTSFAVGFFSPINEHIMPLLRLCYLAGTFVGGLDATPLRVALVLVHAAGGLACGLLVFYHCGSRMAMWAAGTVYAGLSGFAGSVIWLPANANYLLSAVAVSFALVLLCGAYGSRKWSLMVCWAVVALGAGAFTGAVLVAVAIPAYCLLLRPSLGASRRVVVLTYFCLAVVLLLAARGVLLHYDAGFRFRPEARHAWKGFWLAYTAPLRFANAWGLHSSYQLSSMVKLSVAAWLLLAASLFLLPQRARRLLACLWAGPLTLMVLIAAGRSTFSLVDFYLTDRYYYYFLLPLSAHCGFLLVPLASALALRLRIGPGLAATVLLCLAAPLLAGSRARLRDSVLWTIYGFHSRALANGQALIRIIASRAAQRSPVDPLLLVDGPIPFDGVHKNTISLACLLFTEFTGGLPGVRLIASGLDEKSARAQNLILDEWSERVGAEASPVCVEGGRLKNAGAVSWIDFRKGSFEGAVVSGFHSWEGTYRWTSSSSSLRLIPAGQTLVIRAYAPMPFLRSKWPTLQGIRTTVQVNGARAGDFQVTSEQEEEFRIPVPAELLSKNSGRPDVLVTLATDLVWRAADVTPESADVRQLALAITAIGFPSGAGSGRAANPCATRIVNR